MSSQVVLGIDTQFLERLKQADKSLEKLIERTDHLTSSFETLTTNGIDKFSQAIDAIVKQVGTLSKIKVGDLDLSTTSDAAKKTVDSVNEIANAALKIKSSSVGGNPIEETLGNMFDKAVRLKEEITQFQEWEGGQLINADDYKYIGEVTDELNKLMSLYEALDDANKRMKSSSGLFKDHMDAITNTDLESLRSKDQLSQMAEYYKEEDRLENEKLTTTKKRYKEILSELEKLEAQQTRVNDARKKYGDDYDAQVAEQHIIERQSALNAERVRIEEQHQEQLTDIQEASERSRAKKLVDAAERAAREAAEARKKAEKDTESYKDTYRGAMQFSKTARSIQEQTEAIKHLKTARANLSRNDFSSEKAYKRAINEITVEIDNQQNSIKKLQFEYKLTQEIGSQFKTVMSNIFGLAAIKGYSNQLVKVRGEFELQHKSLQVLLQNKDEADRLWNQTVKLAVKSPFKVDELVTATKQLAAYRIESDKLHSTTQMLADISAGLGVDMNRLILAFGQVKAANFLRGTELRQFSEAGVNILDELAEHYSMLEGKIVSVGDVFDRVSKRMVSFADVETVLQNITGKGGAFYKMQEQQAETLKGQVRNLKDSLMLMYNDIGEMSDDTLKGVVSLLRSFVENWRSIAEVMAPVLSAFVTYKGLLIILIGLKKVFNPLLNIGALAMVKFGYATENASRRVLILNRAMRANPVIKWISIIGSLVAAFGGLVASFDKTEDSVKNVDQIFDENARTVKRTTLAIHELTKEREELLSVESRTEEQEKRLNDVTQTRSVLLDELATKNKEYASTLRLAGDDTEAMAEALRLQNEELDAMTALYYRVGKFEWNEIADAQTAKETVTGASAEFRGLQYGGAQEDLLIKDIENQSEIIQRIAPVRQLLVDAINESGGEIALAVELFAKKAGASFEMAEEVILSAVKGSVFEGAFRDYFKFRDKISETLDELEPKVKADVVFFAKTAFGQSIVDALSGTDEDAKQAALKNLKEVFSDLFTKMEFDDFTQGVWKKQVADIFKLDPNWFDLNYQDILTGWRKGYNEFLAKLIGDRQIAGITKFTSGSESRGDKVKELKDALKDADVTLQLWGNQQGVDKKFWTITEKDKQDAEWIKKIVPELLKILGEQQQDETTKKYKGLISTITTAPTASCPAYGSPPASQ